MKIGISLETKGGEGEEEGREGERVRFFINIFGLYATLQNNILP